MEEGINKARATLYFGITERGRPLYDMYLIYKAQIFKVNT